MLFNSIDFMIFFPIVLIVYFGLPGRIRQYWLLVASYYFYMCWNPAYIILIVYSTIITYVGGLMLERAKKKGYEASKERKRKKLIVAVCFILTLSILVYFKYANFTISLLTTALSGVHIQVNVPQFDILLPVGISFFTFQVLGYIIDVYRNEIYAEKNFFRYALFVSFFPQLVAGPIERSKNLLKQIAIPKQFDFDRAIEGFLLMLWGFFLKLVLADRIALFVDTVYSDVDTYAGYYIVVATMLFAVQIYCDFAGYSVIAMGTAKILGIDLMENFEAPYLSTSVAEFWRKWHISLTSWFKDYLYIPLGGSHKGKIRKYINKLVVFCVSGLWHGASTSFIIWGGVNGLYQIIGEMLQPVKDKATAILNLNRQSLGHKIMQVLWTFLLIDFSWIFFRAENTRVALTIIKRMISENNPWILLDGSLYTCGLDEKNFRLMILGIAVLLVADFCKKRNVVIRKIFMKQDWWCRILSIVLFVNCILIFGIWGGSFEASNFIYFQF